MSTNDRNKTGSQSGKDHKSTQKPDTDRHIGMKNPGQDHTSKSSMSGSDSTHQKSGSSDKSKDH